MKKCRCVIVFLLFILLPSAFILFSSGCSILGFAAYAMPRPDVQPKYSDLASQSVGVMVWADRGIRIDWPTLQIDIAGAIQKKLADAQAGKKKLKQLLGTTFPVHPESIVRFQKDHPETEAEHITATAPKLGVTRLIYIELEDFATRSDMSVDLYRGQAKATVRVIEVDPAGQGKIGFELSNVMASFPPKAPREGIPGAGDARIYMGIVDAFATEVAHQFIPYQPED